MWIGSNNREPDEPVWNFLSKFVMLYILPFSVHCSRQQTRSKPRASSAATSTWIQRELKCKCKQMKSISCSPIMNANLTYKPVHEGIKPLLFRSLTVTALQKHKESKKCNFWGVIRVFFPADCLRMSTVFTQFKEDSPLVWQTWWCRWRCRQKLAL